jgi:hypothetical protein
MGHEEEREAYDVLIIMADGTAGVFQHYPQAHDPHPNRVNHKLGLMGIHLIHNFRMPL